MEIALFRMLQESLTNVYRHSTSNTAEIRLESAKQSVTLEVRDYGKGIPSNLLDQFRNEGSGSGVGLAGMRERIQELGGSLVIISDEAGTLVRATVPAGTNRRPRTRLESVDEVGM
jgi:signal transduction histidine kinase